MAALLLPPLFALCLAAAATQRGSQLAQGSPTAVRMDGHPGPPWGPPGGMNCGGSDVCYRGCVPGTVAATQQYCNLSLSLEGRLNALVAAMTFDERVEIMKAHGHGGCARIGLPGYEFDSDGLHGYSGPCSNGSKASCPTTFPAPPTLGCAWNLSGIELMGEVISSEHRAWHNSEGHRNASSAQLGSTSTGQTLGHIGVSIWGPTLNVNRSVTIGPASQSVTSTATFSALFPQLRIPLGPSYTMAPSIGAIVPFTTAPVDGSERLF